jgi:Methyltransferase domain
MTLAPPMARQEPDGASAAARPPEFLCNSSPMFRIPNVTQPRVVLFDGKPHDISRYAQMHENRFRHSVQALRKYAQGKVLEVGGHPWAMTALIAETPGFDLSATVSAEEVTLWPDPIGIQRTIHTLQAPQGREVKFTNYSLNIERSLVDLDEKVDAVFACEVIEHLVRAPHIMLLNINRWMRIGGTALISTPNGMQFSNPFRRKNARPAYRCHCYERHNGLLTMEQLEDLARRSGFQILESGYWNVYDRSGPSRVYDALSKLPIEYCHAKFSRTIFVIAEKIEDREVLDGLPKAYAPSIDWEHISQG